MAVSNVFIHKLQYYVLLLNELRVCVGITSYEHTFTTDSL